ncbi:MAG: EamA family transporter [Solirubrobacteraceae bacterium]|nr:EamA family transporter [Solirubrobacteraceae bacterium]
MPRLQVLFAAILFGTTGTAMELGPDASPLAVGAARIAVGGALLLLAARLIGARMPRDRRAIAGVALGIAVYQLSFFAAVDLTGVAVGTVVAIGTGPAVAGGLGALLNGEQLTRRWVIATSLAGIGVALLVLGGSGDASIEPLGIVLAVIAGAGYGTYTVVSKGQLQRGADPEGVMASGFASAGILLLPVLLIAGPGFLAEPGGLALALYLGAIPTALAYVLFARGLRHLSSGETATIVLAEPVTAAALGMTVLDETPGTIALVGAGLVLAGLAVLALPRREEPTTADVVPA